VWQRPERPVRDEIASRRIWLGEIQRRDGAAQAEAVQQQAVGGDVVLVLKEADTRGHVPK
jgi:hypothetical protein